MIKLMRQLLQWAPELKGKFFLAALFKIVEAMFMGAPYGFIFLTLNDLLAGSLSMKKVAFYTGGMAFCFLGQGICSYFFSRTIWPTANYLVKKLRIMAGEHLRISIARAILKDAPIILLDEATASVDPENEYLIQSAINALVESKTLIIIAHRLSTIVAADQIIVLNDHGQVEETGKHEELLKNKGIYARLWKSRVQAKKWHIGTSKGDS